MRQKFLTTIICAITVVTAAAQEERPFEPLFVEGRSWVYWYDNFFYPERNDFYTYTVEGETIVNSQECKCLVVRLERGNRVGRRIPVYEDGEKSFVIPADWDSFSPIFDFSVKPGDVVEQKFQWEVYDRWVVKDIEEIEVRGYKRRKIILEDCDYPSFGTFYWLEGIGAITLYDAMTVCPIIPDSGGYYFQECRQDGEIILTREDMGLAGINELRSDSAQKDGVVYDIHGRRVEQPQRGHIYIRDGKKFVQR